MNLQQRIRNFYKEMMPYIEKHYPGFDPYIFDFYIPLTPIELNVWSDIRYLGLPIKCWQFPVNQYFLDFADPIRKIGIEVDGKEWHLDYYKDKKRQDEIEAEGWTIYRIEGRQTFKTEEDYLSEDDRGLIRSENSDEDAYVLIENRLREYYIDCSEGILKRIKENHYPNLWMYARMSASKPPTKIGDILSDVFSEIGVSQCHVLDT